MYNKNKITCCRIYSKDISVLPAVPKEQPMEMYTIGEVSQVCGISAKMLRYFDQIDLLKPGVRNPENGYRYYTREQIFDVFLIKRFQLLGFSLKEITRLFELDSPTEYADRISEKMAELRSKIEDLEKIYEEGTILRNKLQLKGFKAGETPEGTVYSAGDISSMIEDSSIHIEEIRERDVLFTKKTMEDYKNTDISIERWFEMYQTARDRGLSVTGSITLTYHVEHPMEQFFKSHCELEVMLPVEKGDVDYDDIKTFGGFNAAVAVHTGGYEDISSTHLKLLAWIESHGLKLGGKISEEYILSPVDMKSYHGFITKVIAPLATEYH